MAAGSIEKEPVAKKLPASFQVNKLKLLCKRLFDLEPEQQVREECMIKMIVMIMIMNIGCTS